LRSVASGPDERVGSPDRRVLALLAVVTTVKTIVGRESLKSYAEASALYVVQPQRFAIDGHCHEPPDREERDLRLNHRHYQQFRVTRIW
jgi:hypothetical protein